MSTVEEMLGLFQRYECFEQAGAVVRGHLHGTHFGGGSNSRSKRMGQFEGFPKNNRFVICAIGSKLPLFPYNRG